MDYDPLVDDPLPDKNYPPSLEPVIFESGGCRLLGVLFLAQGEGPHPGMVLLHGFPGYERNFDLAHIFRRAGWNVLVFHYRGAWGSEGSFSFTHALEDVKSALAFLKSSRQLYRMTASPVVVGHSMGGFAALMTAVYSCVPSAVSIAGFNLGYFFGKIGKNENNLEETTRFLEDSLPPLQGTSADDLVQEAVSNAEPWNLLSHAHQLSKRSLLLMGGSRDETAPLDMHHWPLVDALRNHHAEDLTDRILDTDHVFSDKRITLARTILTWLNLHI